MLATEYWDCLCITHCNCARRCNFSQIAVHYYLQKIVPLDNVTENGAHMYMCVTEHKSFLCVKRWAEKCARTAAPLILVLPHTSLVPNTCHPRNARLLSPCRESSVRLFTIHLNNCFMILFSLLETTFKSWGNAGYIGGSKKKVWWCFYLLFLHVCRPDHLPCWTFEQIKAYYQMRHYHS